MATPQAPNSVENAHRIADRHFDPEFCRHLVDNVLAHIDEYYFRTRYVGLDRFPQRNHPDHPLIFASNHSGMAFPWDAIMLSVGLFRRSGYTMQNAARALSSPMLSMTNLMNPYLIPNFWKRCGGVDAQFKNFDAMMHYPDSQLLIYPEGVPGIGKGFPKRYQLQRFATSFIRMSLKYRTDILPIATVNGEYVNPYNVSSEYVNKLANKLMIPFIPVGLMTLLIPFQPWIFYLGFPAQLTYVLGQRIKPYEMTDKPYETLSDREVRQIRDRVKDIMQSQLSAAVARYGQQPYNAKDLFGRILRNPGKFPFYMPCFWPSLFREADRRYQAGDKTPIRVSLWQGIKAFLKDPMLFAFFIPILGWIPILAKGLQKVKPRNPKTKPATNGPKT